MGGISSAQYLSPHVPYRLRTPSTVSTTLNRLCQPDASTQLGQVDPKMRLIAAITSGFNSGLSAAAGPAVRGRLRLVNLRLSYPAGTRPSPVVTDSLDYLLVLWQTASLPAIRVHNPLVNVDIKHADRALLHLRLNGEFLLDGGRQTGGRTKPASLVTIDDLDLLDLAHFV